MFRAPGRAAVIRSEAGSNGNFASLSSDQAFCDERLVMTGTVRLIAVALALVAAPALARDSLGIFSGWGAFRDAGNSAGGPRCYAIAMAAPSTLSREYQPYAAVGTWPKRGLRGQLHFRLSRKLAPTSAISLRIGRQRFALTGGGGDAWAADQRMDAAIVAAMRSASEMAVSARGADGRSFFNYYALAGAATAMDAATIGCARLK